VITVDKNPNSAGGEVFEGLPVDLSGIVLTVRYSDNTWGKVTNPAQITIVPSIYDWRLYAQDVNFTTASGTSYTSVGNYAAWGDDDRAIPVSSGNNAYFISYKEGNSQPVGVAILASDLGIHRRLLDINWTGSMRKQDYLVDDLPDFSGLTVEGVYSNTDGFDLGVDGNEDPDSPGGTGTQATYYHKAIPLSTDVRDYEWRWIWNNSVGVATVSGFVGQDPGVLITMGSYGNPLSTVLPGNNLTTADPLTGEDPDHVAVPGGEPQLLA